MAFLVSLVIASVQKYLDRSLVAESSNPDIGCSLYTMVHPPPGQVVELGSDKTVLGGRMMHFSCGPC